MAILYFYKITIFVQKTQKKGNIMKRKTQIIGFFIIFMVFIQVVTSCDIFGETNPNNTDNSTVSGQTVPALQTSVYPTIDNLVTNPTTIQNSATLLQFDGNLTITGQQDQYTFVPSVDGRYRFEITNLATGNVDLIITNSVGTSVGSSTYVSNGSGVTINNINGGETYTIQVRQRSGLSQYRLTIGHQKPTVNITGYTVVNDSMQFNDQYNNYKWTVSSSGIYRFEISNLTTGNIDIVITNSVGTSVGSSTYMSNGSGVTINNINGGETYTIQVRQRSGLSQYKLNIRKQ